MRLSVFPLSIAAAALVLVSASVLAQEAKSFDEAAKSLPLKAEASRVELSNLQAVIREEKAPLTQSLRALEDELAAVKKEYEEILRQRDTRSLDVSTVKNRIESKKKQNEYLTGLLDDYLSQLDTRLHIGEVQRYKDRLEKNRNDAANANLSPKEKLEARLDTLTLSMERIDDAMGGTRYPGSAVDDNGVIGQGQFVQLGPIVYFAGEDESHTGLTDSRLGSNEPAIIPVPEAFLPGITALANTGNGSLPFDSTRGTARKIEETKETLIEHIQKGGAVMYPLLLLAAVSLIIGLIKWVQLVRVRRVDTKRFDRIMVCVVNGQEEKAIEMAQKFRGPIGNMLSAGIAHHKEPRDLIEEVLYEKVLEARTRLNSFIPVSKITAAAAPLLGLLGTVSGMINTFKLITVLGTSDAQNFSSGISEALITTEWGLIVAIPSLMLAAFLTRKSKSVLDDMEKISVGFLNHLPGGDDDSPQLPTPTNSPPAPRRPVPEPEESAFDPDAVGLPQT
jgi:biopolymer transport protein ExbB